MNFEEKIASLPRRDRRAAESLTKRGKRRRARAEKRRAQKLAAQKLERETKEDAEAASVQRRLANVESVELPPEAAAIAPTPEVRAAIEEACSPAKPQMIRCIECGAAAAFIYDETDKEPHCTECDAIAPDAIRDAMLAQLERERDSPFRDEEHGFPEIPPDEDPGAQALIDQASRDTLEELIRRGKLPDLPALEVLGPEPAIEPAPAPRMSKQQIEEAAERICAGNADVSGCPEDVMRVLAEAKMRGWRGAVTGAEWGRR